MYSIITMPKNYLNIFSVLIHEGKQTARGWKQLSIYFKVPTDLFEAFFIRLDL